MAVVKLHTGSCPPPPFPLNPDAQTCVIVDVAVLPISQSHRDCAGKMQFYIRSAFSNVLNFEPAAQGCGAVITTVFFPLLWDIPVHRCMLQCPTDPQTDGYSQMLCMLKAHTQQCSTQFRRFQLLPVPPINCARRASTTARQGCPRIPRG